MSEDKGQQEPSMEDILASIRRILSEDDVEEPAKPPAKPAAAAPAPVLQAEPDPEPEDDVLELDDSMVITEPAREPEPEDDLLDLSQFEVPQEKPQPEPEPDFDAMFEPAPEPEARPMFAAEPAIIEPEPPVQPEPQPLAESLLAPAVAEASTSALSELARAVARERGVGLGTRGLTLEDLVRDMMRPILKDWLDQNLPYMVERIVRNEIERMVNRAEKQ